MIYCRRHSAEPSRETDTYYFTLAECRFPYVAEAEESEECGSWSDAYTNDEHQSPCASAEFAKFWRRGIRVEGKIRWSLIGGD